MYVILGATGRVGNTVIESLLPNKKITAVFRDSQKAQALQNKGVSVRITDYLDTEELQLAFRGAKTVFLITSENLQSLAIFKDNEKLLKNYETAIQTNEVQKILALSSFGAQHNNGTVNLLFSHQLEKINIPYSPTKIFLRPAYYFSNWLNYLPIIKEQGVLPTFFPPELKIHMISPKTVGQFAAKLMEDKKLSSKTIEVEGPERYSAKDIVEIFSHVLKQKIEVMHIPREKWEENLSTAGFSKSAIKGLIKMTEAVINGKAHPAKNSEKVSTTFYEYLNEQIV